MQNFKLGMCMGHHLSMKGVQKGYLFCQKWFTRKCTRKILGHH